MEDKVEFVIKNLNREKIFKEIIKTTHIYDVKINDGEIFFTIKRKDAKKVEKILEKKYIKINNKREKGIFIFLKKNVLKIGILIPIFLFLIFIFIANNYVFQYDIQGLELISENEIIEILNGQGLKTITHKKDINLTQIENQIQKVDRVSLVSAIIKGNTLVINIKEKVYNPEYEDKENFKPIISVHNAIITEVTVIQGTPMVKAGQVVQKGQILVSPFVEDTSGNMRSVNPLADIKADVYYTTITEVADAKIEYVETGNSFTKRQILIGKNIIFDDGIICEYKSYKTNVQKEFVANHILLPIEYVVTTYFEQKEVFVEDYFEKNQTQILEDCKKKTRQLFAEYEIIKDEYYEITSLAGINRITYTCVINSCIS